MREVAAAAGVAISSVSRVLAGHPDVSPAMRERVMAAVDQLGYRPDLLAQGLRRQQTMSVGFVVGDISNPLLADIVTGAERVLRDAGYSLLLTNSEGDPGRDAEHIALLERRRVDGLLLSLASERSPATLARLAGLDVPAVVIDRRLPRSLGVGAVLSDHASGMTAAINHLLDLGHRHIGVLLARAVRPMVERRRAVERTYAKRGLAPTYRVRSGVLTPDSASAVTSEMLDGAAPPTAFVVGSNQLLIGTLRTLRDRGLRVGSDVSLISCDEVPLTELHEPPISVIERDTKGLGAAAATLLLARMRDEEGDNELLTPARYVPRASCAPAPALVR